MEERFKRIDRGRMTDRNRESAPVVEAWKDWEERFKRIDRGIMTDRNREPAPVVEACKEKER